MLEKFRNRINLLDSAFTSGPKCSPQPAEVAVLEGKNHYCDSQATNSRGTIKNALIFFASFSLLTFGDAVTIDTSIELGTLEEPAEAKSIESGLVTGPRTSRVDALRVNPLGAVHRGVSYTAELEAPQTTNAAPHPSPSWESNVMATTQSLSISVFSIALMGIGSVVALLGLVGLSFGQKMEAIRPEDYVSQLRSLSLRAILFNVSRNWRVKRDATWFVIIGLSAIAFGLIDWVLS